MGVKIKQAGVISRNMPTTRFEDVRSLKAKFDLIKELDLSGVGYWQIMNYFRANWLLLADMFEIKEGIL